MSKDPRTRGESGPSHKGYCGVPNIHFPPRLVASNMPSNHHTHLNHPTLPNFLLGFSSFVVLCGIKALQMMQHQQPSQPGRPPRIPWQNFSNDKVFNMLNILIEQKLKMGQSSSFTLTTFNLVARQLGTGRPASSYQTKYNSVCCFV